MAQKWLLSILVIPHFFVNSLQHLKIHSGQRFSSLHSLASLSRTLSFSFRGVGAYAQGVINAMKGIDIALQGLQNAQSELASALVGANGTSRCLFTNAHPQLGNLSSILKMMSETFININKVQEAFQSSLKIDVGEVLQELLALDDEKERLVKKKEMEGLYEEYESLLAASLSSRNKVTPEKHAELIEVRKEYELARFDIVANLNKLNGKKKRFFLYIYHNSRTSELI